MFKNIALYLIEHNLIAIVFYKILYMSIIGSLIGIVILCIRKIFGKKILAKWKCILWSMFIISLIIPFRYEIAYYKQISNNVPNNISKSIEYIEKIPNTIVLDEKQDVISQSEVIVEDNKNNEFIENEVIDKKVDNDLKMKDVLTIIVIPYLWLICFSIFILLIITKYFKYQKNLTRCNDIVINDILNQCLKKFKCSNKVRLYFINKNISPSIFGLIKPKILISKESLNHSNEELQYAFMHEIAHYKRKDLLYNFFAFIILGIHFFNPIIWYMYRRIREDIELAADEYVLKFIDIKETKKYGLTLLNFLQTSDNYEYTDNYLCLSDTEKNMERRIHMIKSPIKSKIFGIIIVIISLIVIGLFVFTKIQNKENIVDNVENKSTILSDNYEHLWTEPLEYSDYNDMVIKNKTKYDGPQNLTDEEMKKCISEEKAMEIAKNILIKTGHGNEKITKSQIKKNMYEQGKTFYSIFTNNVEIVLIAETGDFYAIFSPNYVKQDIKTDNVSEEEAQKYVDDFFNSCDFLEYDKYKYDNIKRQLNAQGTDYKYSWNAQYFEILKSGILNAYKRWTIDYEIINGNIYVNFLRKFAPMEENSNFEWIFSDNEIKITEEDAINIATKEDQSFSGQKIKSTDTFLTNSTNNYYVWLEKNPDKKSSMHAKSIDEKTGEMVNYTKYYYDKYYIRNVYKVIVRYDVGENVFLDDANYGRVYFVDATTGEILGGENYDYVYVDSKSINLYDKDMKVHTTEEVKYFDKLTNELIGIYHYNLSESEKKEFFNRVEEDV